MNEALKNLLERRSCRSYKEDQIKKEELDEILKAGTYAPTGMGKQSPLIVVVQDKEKIDKIERINAEIMGNKDIHTFYGAPTLIIVFGNKNEVFCKDDANLVIGNILNAANAVGVDSCYIWRAKETFETETGKQWMKEWNIPDNFVGVGNVILGYGKPEGKREAPARKSDYMRFV